MKRIFACTLAVLSFVAVSAQKSVETDTIKADTLPTPNSITRHLPFPPHSSVMVSSGWKAISSNRSTRKFAMK